MTLGLISSSHSLNLSLMMGIPTFIIILLTFYIYLNLFQKITIDFVALQETGLINAGSICEANYAFWECLVHRLFQQYWFCNMQIWLVKTIRLNLIHILFKWKWTGALLTSLLPTYHLLQSSSDHKHNLYDILAKSMSTNQQMRGLSPIVLCVLRL